MHNYIPIIKINQWLNTWEKAHWQEDKGLGKPSDHFFMGSMPITELRSLAGVTQREIEQRKNPNASAGYQRAHEAARSQKINRYLHYGYPLSTSQSLDPIEHAELINPGWLPNAIIINILPPSRERFRDGEIHRVPEELEVKITSKNSITVLEYPNEDAINHYKTKNASYLEPIEIIDGQHRLYAVDYHSNLDGHYDVPVVMFYDLSLAWQAYLFWTINVEPKKINASLAFDLYPELRRQEWLDKSDSIKIYQEHRSQEMTEMLWSHPKSPWKDRIELFGTRVKGHVSNASFIRSLNTSFIKKWSTGDRIGGLFGSIEQKDGSSDRVIPWQRSQQAAFLIAIWRSVHEATSQSHAEWVSALTPNTQLDIISNLSPAFAGEHTLLATDQGVRAIHNIFNSIFQDSPDLFLLDKWHAPAPSGPMLTPDEIDRDIKSFKTLENANKALKSISKAIIDNFDWRLSSAPGLNQDEKQMQSAYRGSGGYSLMLSKLIKIISDHCSDDTVKKISSRIASQISR